MVDVRVVGQCDRMHDRIKPYLSNDGRCAGSQSYQSVKEALDVDHDAGMSKWSDMFRWCLVCLVGACVCVSVREWCVCVCVFACGCV